MDPDSINPDPDPQNLMNPDPQNLMNPDPGQELVSRHISRHIFKVKKTFS